MGNIHEAMQWLKSGLKIRRKNWNIGNFLTLTKSGKIINNKGDTVDLSYINPLLANDWEVYKDKTDEEDDELLDILDVIKYKDVKPKELLIRVYDLKSKKEGWISFNQIIKNIEDLVENK